MSIEQTRAPGDHGTALQAIEWALDHNPDGWLEAGNFLNSWLHGDAEEWPEFYAWLATQPVEEASHD